MSRISTRSCGTAKITSTSQKLNSKPEVRWPFALWYICKNSTRIWWENWDVKKYSRKLSNNFCNSQTKPTWEKPKQFEHRKYQLHHLIAPSTSASCRCWSELWVRRWAAISIRRESSKAVDCCDSDSARRGRAVQKGKEFRMAAKLEPFEGNRPWTRGRYQPMLPTNPVKLNEII